MNKRSSWPSASTHSSADSGACRTRWATNSSPQYLDAVGEATGPKIDNLNRMEKLGLIDSAELWMTLRDLRNQMMNEYSEDADTLANALNKAHEHAGTLIRDAQCILADLEARDWISARELSVVRGQ